MKRRRTWVKPLAETALELTAFLLIRFVLEVVSKGPLDGDLLVELAVYSVVFAPFLFFRNKKHEKQRQEDAHHREKVESLRRERSAFGTQKGESNARPH